MRSFTEGVVGALLYILMAGTLIVGGFFLAIDALELETTGECEECLILPALRPGN